jgi:predicted RNA-binding protein
MEMCEANVYISRNGQEELLMEKVDRIIPGEDNTILMENIFGERRVVKARIREMELVHHRIILEEIRQAEVNRLLELWLELGTEHGHFHGGEEVTLQVHKGYNMHPDAEADGSQLQAFLVNAGQPRELKIHDHHGTLELKLEQALEGLAQVYVQEEGDRNLYATVLVEVGHHHHHGVKPVGLPLEIVPSDYSHARLGENYEVQVLKDGQPLVGADVRVTYSSTQNHDYPHHLTTDAEGRARIFLTARGNYLFSVTDGNTISTFTLIKSF